MHKYIYLVEIFLHRVGKPIVIKRNTREKARGLSRAFKRNGHKVTIKQVKLTEENVKVVR